MESIFKIPFAEPLCTEDPFFVQQGIEKCPFLRNINEPTHFSFSSSRFPIPARGARGPIFEDGPDFESAFKLFHGQNGVVPLEGRSFQFGGKNSDEITETGQKFNPLAAKAATISLSAFGPGGPFGFESFNKKFNEAKKPSIYAPTPQKGIKINNSLSLHESTTNEWLATGQCPLAKSYRAVSDIIPLVSSLIKPPAGIKLKCPPAIVAVRAALARTEFATNLRPKPLHYKILSIALLGMALNVPLGVWRAHCAKFSVQWFLAVHAAVPFIGMMRKVVLMPKAAMVFTLGASILGQAIGARAEKIRMIRVLEEGKSVSVEKLELERESNFGEKLGGNELGLGIAGKKNCGDVRVWEMMPMKIEGGNGGGKSAICY
ncbi:hypothetical protein LUZ60_014185 [Juncus effusus]|nr:hypothetical protein LUZ60_014185 [Juncus effusus]